MIGKIAIFVIAAAVTSVFFINFCHAVYGCGCTYLWAGADKHCNIHNPVGKHCPWCAIGLGGSLGVWGSIVAAQAFVAFWRRPMSSFRRLAATVATFPIAGLVLAVIMGIRMGYWE